MDVRYRAVLLMLFSLALGAILLWQGDSPPRASATVTPAAPVPAPPLTEAQLAALHLVPAWDITYTYVSKVTVIGTRPTGQLVCPDCWPARLVGVVGAITGVSFNQVDEYTFTVSLTVAGQYFQSDCQAGNNPCIPKLTEYPASLNVVADSRIKREEIQFESGCPGGQVYEGGYKISGSLSGAQLNNPSYAKYNYFGIDYTTNPPTAYSALYTAGLTGQYRNTGTGCVSGDPTVTSGPFPRNYYYATFQPGSGVDPDVTGDGDTQVRVENGRFVIRGSDDTASTRAVCDGILISCYLGGVYQRPYTSTHTSHLEWEIRAHDPTIPTIHSVEFTQAIQELQPLATLKADIFFDGTPPVPIVAKKPGTIRVFVDQVPALTGATVEVSGLVNGEFFMVLQPHCTPVKRRRLQENCYGYDFDFVPPVGNWTVTVKLKQGDTVLESHDLNLTSKKSDALVLKAVSVCDSVVGAVVWQCAPASDLGPLVSLLRHIAPTDDVRVEVTNHQVKLRVIAGNPNGDMNDNGTPALPGDDTPVLDDCYDAAGSVVPTTGAVYECEADAWWDNIAGEIQALFTVFDFLGGTIGEQRYYYGMVRAGVPGSAGIGFQPGRGAASKTQVDTLGVVPWEQYVVAHETNHMLGRKHTGTSAPAPAPGATFGCWSSEEDAPDWPYADNLLRSGPAPGVLQVGINTYTGALVLPESNFEVIAYCAPGWISPFGYLQMLKVLDPPPPDPVGEPGTFWHVSGTIEGGAATLDPLIKLDTLGPMGAGTGTHRIEVRDGSGAVLFTRFFTPSIPHLAVTSDDPPAEGLPFFSQLVPIQASAASIVAMSGTDVQIGQVALGGTAPAVTITSPLAGTMNGVQTLSWSVVDPDSASHSFYVHYSTDSGATWMSLASSLGENELKVEFDTLPGSTGTSRIRVIASDGVNSGEAVSPPFTVGPKLPEATVLFPESGAVFAQGQMVVLQGQGFDVDDGFLEGASLQWSSSKDGTLGTGAELPVATLTAGVHAITLKATDSQGNQSQDGVTIYMGTEVLVDLPEGSPTANPGGPYEGPALASIAFDGTGSTDPEGQALTYQWDFGDGQTGTGATPGHAYAAGGTYLVSLTVTDPTSLSHTQTALAMVQQAEPTPTPTPIPGTGWPGLVALGGALLILLVLRLRRKHQGSAGSQGLS